MNTHGITGGWSIVGALGPGENSIGGIVVVHCRVGAAGGMNARLLVPRREDELRIKAGRVSWAGGVGGSTSIVEALALEGAVKLSPSPTGCVLALCVGIA